MTNNNDEIKLIFERALELNEQSRELFFKNLSKEEKQYEQEVRSLLNAYETNEDFLQTNNQTITTSDDPGPHPLIGQHVGSYLIEEEIGIGGMGIVFLGKRDDKEFEQKVAVKIIKQGITSDYLLKRFQNERQTLANLQHSNIAKIFDGGKTSEGLPYLVMEFINGVPITKYCEENSLSVNERLQLFITVCNAVQYAHQNLVIHRDIKPGNILVNKEGIPILLDFGVAKLLDIDEKSEEVLTRPGMWHLTPEYASPEQIKGHNITTASDTYSLGILLFKLLTGSEPYKIYNNSPGSISKILDEQKAIRPSEIGLQQTGEKSNDKYYQLNHQKSLCYYKEIKGDLDNIVLKAMHKEPLQRYSSVQAFADDISRYLKGQPVVARADTLIYRYSKFVYRHKVGVGLFILFNILIWISLGAIIYQGKIAAEERDKAKVENQKYEKVNSFLTNILSSVDPSEIGRDVKVYDILEKAAENVESNLKNQPEIDASIRSTIGNTYVNLGEYDRGKPFLEKAYEINKSIYGEHSKETATNIHDLGLYYDWIGEYQLADSLYEKSIKIFRKVLSEPTKIFADALNNFAIVKMNLSQYDIAEQLYLEAIDNSKKAEGEKNRNVAVMMNNLAINSVDLGKLDEAEEYYKKSLQLILELLGSNRPEVGSAYNNMASLYVQKNEFDSAEVYLQKSYDLKYKLKGKDHPDVGLALNNLGVLEIHRENYDKAEQYFINGIKQYLKAYPSDHPLIALSDYWLGRVYFNKNQFGLAEKHYRKCLKVRMHKLPENNREIWKTKSELGINLVKLKKLKEAEELLSTSYEYYISEQPDDQKAIQNILYGLIKMYKEQKDDMNLAKYQKLIDQY